MLEELNNVIGDLQGSMEVLMEDYNIENIENESFPSIELMKPDQRDVLTQLGSFSFLAGGICYDWLRMILAMSRMWLR